MNNLDTIRHLTVSLSENNPGALSVLKEMWSAPLIDEVNIRRALGTLEAYDIKGPKIWIVYKDLCKEDIGQFISDVVYDIETVIERLEGL